MRFYLLFICIFALAACETAPNKPNTNVSINTVNRSNTNAVNTTTVKTNEPVPVYTYEIVKSYPHDSKAFTQGLIFRDGFLYESTGQEGESTIRKVELNTGKVLQKYDVPEEYFAEGMTFFGDKFYQITWQEKTAFVYDKDFKLLKQLNYAGEGWGLTHDGTNLIMSDGTHVIRYVNPENFQTVRTISVFQENGKPLMNLNELEFIKGEIWANIWHSESPEVLGKPNYIARIDANSGKLLGWIDLSSISPDDVNRESENTLNGIAYDEASDRLFVTGKRWKKLFEIKVKPKQ
ncbi:MAG: glutaminyl-peptide cyclotransferase [Pyrinomonadaceae bacterium]|nr:glutaminyl-peptide cyclotransferase [Pyrinomonadaceae bacterium]